ncbi:MAG TPA: glucose-6-phosphate isomerase family protein [Bacillota bacterium]|nr:glucose-6-phosphate isomerase family protein [Bacillota bacterium]
MISAALLSRLDLTQGVIDGAPVTRRYLSDLIGTFADEAAYQEALRQGNPLLYAVSSIEPAQGEGQLHYGLGVLMPGKVGREYYMTKGHFHAWRPAAEVYVGLRGRGLMLLEEEATGQSRLLPLEPNGIVYVPGYTAHRTINTGEEPLVYLGIYPAAAGHDYGSIAARNFRHVVVERNGQPVMLERASL